MKKKLILKKLIPVIIIILLSYFTLSLYWKPMPKTIEFELDPQSRTNFSTAHFSFFIDEVEFETSISEVSNFIITKNSKITFGEQPLVPYDPKDDSHYTADGNEKVPHNSMMNFVLEKEKKLCLKLVKNKYRKQLKPVFFQSSQIKAMVLTVDKKHYLEITTEDEKYVLILLIDHEITSEYALEILKSVRYRAD